MTKLNRRRFLIATFAGAAVLVAMNHVKPDSDPAGRLIRQQFPSPPGNRNRRTECI